MPGEETSAATNAAAVEQTEGAGASASEFAEADPIFAALASHTPEEFVAEGEEGKPAEAKKPEEAPAKTEPEKPKESEVEKPDAKSKRKKLESEVFAEQALATPEGVKRAREYVQQRQSKLDGIGQRTEEERAQLKSEREAFAAAVQQARQEIEPQRQLAQRFLGTLEKLNNPASIEEFIDALGELSGRPGIEVWENGARFMVAGGKRPQPSREVEALRAELAEHKRQLAEKEQRTEQAREESQVAEQREFVQRREQEIATAAKDATKYPELARHVTLGMAPNVVAEVVNMKRAARQKGQRLGDDEALAIIEGELKKLTAPETRVSASPAGASPAEARVTSIAPSMTRSAASVRDKTEAELAEDLAKDTAALSHILGVQF